MKKLKKNFLFFPIGNIFFRVTLLPHRGGTIIKPLLMRLYVVTKK